MQISTRADYALRALIEMAATDVPVKAEALARRQGIPPRSLETILSELCHQGLVSSRRGADGGYWLGRAGEQITMADVIRATDGPLASVRGERPENLRYSGAAASLGEVWIAVRAAARAVLETVTIDHLARACLPAEIAHLAEHPEGRCARL